jgi:FkbM family methyltransferase
MNVRKCSDDLFYVLPNHKPAVSEWFTPRPGQFVVDAGAHIGYYSLLAAKHGAEVVSIEGNPPTYEALRANLVLNAASSVAAIQAVLGSGAPGKIVYVEGFYGMASSRPEWVRSDELPPAYRTQSQDVITQRLDAVLERFPKKVVDWLLLDVEGSEEEVLRGATETLRRTRHINLEVSDRSDATTIGTLLREAGLEILDRRRQTPHTSYWNASREVG